MGTQRPLNPEWVEKPPPKRRKQRTVNQKANGHAAGFSDGISTRAMLNAMSVYNSEAISRANLAAAWRRLTHGGKRDVAEVCGHLESPTFSDFYSRWLRNPVARRAIDLPVDATWSGTLGVQGFSDWEEFERDLQITSRFAEADRLAGLGEFSIIFIGVSDGSDPNDRTALERPVERLSNLDDITFLQQYGQGSEFGSAEIHTSVTNFSDPRNGLPELYRIKIASDIAKGKYESRLVHWSRVLHIASNRMGNDIIGVPRLMHLIDALDDMEKVVSGSAEMFWQGADRIPVFTMEKPPRGGELESLRSQAEELSHGLVRHLRIAGGSVTTLETATPDPRGIFQALQATIASGVNIPHRILFGSERGELASTQDRNQWEDTVTSRRSKFAWPHIVYQFLQRLEMWGLIDKPWEMVPSWPPIDSLNPSEKAEMALKRAQAMKTAAEAALTGLIPDAILRREIGILDAVEDSGGPPIDENDPAVQDQFRRAREMT